MMDLDELEAVSPATDISTEDEISNINISDVIDVIRTTDPTATDMFDPNRDPAPSTSNQDPSPSSRSTINANNQRLRKEAFTKILEQPASKALRFRYECEGRSAGSIPGVNSTADTKTFPSIQVVGYTGRAVVVVSCVTKDPPYRPHPHNLVGKEGCKKGVCTVEINKETMNYTFSNLGIQCVKKRDIEEALRVREEIRVDPYRTGFNHRSQPSSIDLNAVRLCFQVFLESTERTGHFAVPLAPVVSDPIFDKKAMSDLVIVKLSHASCNVAGGQEMILLCEKVAKEDISVRFFEERDGNIVWEGFGDFQHTNVHKQVAISFRTPRYKSIEVDHSIKCYIQLKRPSDGVTSEALPFEYFSLDSGRRSIFSLRKGDVVNSKLQKSNFEFFNRIITDEKLLFNPNNNGRALLSGDNSNKENEIIDLDTPVDDGGGNSKLPSLNHQVVADVVDGGSSKKQASDDDIHQINNDKTTEWIRKTQFLSSGENQAISSQTNNKSTNNDDDKTLTELLDQVAELDEIYTDHQIRLVNNHDNGHIERELNGFDNSAKLTEDDSNAMDFDELFDDTATYTSLQIAFKNPVPIIDLMPPSPPTRIDFDDITDHYDAVESSSPTSNSAYVIHNPPAPVIDVSPLKRESPKVDDEKLPPLPPKRIKKIVPNQQESNEKEPLSFENHISTSPSQKLSPTHQDSRRGSAKSLQPRPQSQIIIMKPPEQSPLNKRLPPAPPNKHSELSQSTHSLPKAKKPGFFSKLFSRRKSKCDINSNTQLNLNNNNDDVVGDVTPNDSVHCFNPEDPNRVSIKSLQIPTKRAHSKPVGRSVSSVSGKRPHLTADIVHIPLKGDSVNSLQMRSGSVTLSPLSGEESFERASRASTATLSNNLDRKTVSALQLADLPLQDGNMELIAIADRQSLRNLCEGEFGVQLDPSIDLTEAEHYALYTSVAPHATESEFDEASCYYAPMEAGEILTQEEVARRLANPVEVKRKKFNKVANDTKNMILKPELTQQHHQQQKKETGFLGGGQQQQQGVAGLLLKSETIKNEPMDTNSLSPYNITYGNASPSSRSPGAQCTTAVIGNLQSALSAQTSTTSTSNNVFQRFTSPQFAQSQTNYSHYQDPYTAANSNNQQYSFGLFNMIQQSLNAPNLATTNNPPLNIPTNFSSNLPSNPQQQQQNETTIGSLLDLDSQQFTSINSSTFPSMNSGELANLQMSLLENLSAASAPSITPVSIATGEQTTNPQNNLNPDEENMPDSYTRFAIDVLNELNNTQENNNLN